METCHGGAVYGRVHKFRFREENVHLQGNGDKGHIYKAMVTKATFTRQWLQRPHLQSNGDKGYIYRAMVTKATFTRQW